MSLSISFASPLTRCVPRFGAPVLGFPPRQGGRRYVPVLMDAARFKSSSARPPTPEPGPGPGPAATPPPPRMRIAQRKRVPLKQRTSYFKEQAKEHAKPQPKEQTSWFASKPPLGGGGGGGGGRPPAKQPTTTTGTDPLTGKKEDYEAAIIRRRKLLWPGIWTFLALAGTYSTCALLDVKFGTPFPSSDDLPPRAAAAMPQTWFLTPTVIYRGFTSFAADADALTLGLGLAFAAVHLARKKFPALWRRCVHVDGRNMYTAFTYPFLHSSWAHVVANAGALAVFLPAVVHHFDADVFHAAAFVVAIPLVTSYLTHFLFRLNLARGVIFNVGASGAVAAALGVYAVAYPREKIWFPPLPVRVDAAWWAALYAFCQALVAIKPPDGKNRAANLVHIASMLLGVAYAYFDAKHHVWIPLVSELSSRLGEVPVEKSGGEQVPRGGKVREEASEEKSSGEELPVQKPREAPPIVKELEKNRLRKRGINVDE